MNMNLLKDFYTRVESLRGKQLAIVLGVTFVMFLIVGFSINYFTNEILKSTETTDVNSESQIVTPTQTQYQGKITFIEPMNFPQDEISYFLADARGQRIILLTADDQKLQVSEGLNVTVTGYTAQTESTGEDVLVVQSIIIESN